MMAVIEDMRLFLRQICAAIGLKGTAMNVVPVVALGIVLNVAALGMVRSLRIDRRPVCQKTALQSAARTELKVVRTVVASTLKTITGEPRRGCAILGWADGLQQELAR